MVPPHITTSRNLVIHLNTYDHLPCEEVSSPSLEAFQKRLMVREVLGHQRKSVSQLNGHQA